jgi:hypothetical protein
MHHRRPWHGPIQRRQQISPRVEARRLLWHITHYNPATRWYRQQRPRHRRLSATDIDNNLTCYELIPAGNIGITPSGCLLPTPARPLTRHR